MLSEQGVQAISNITDLKEADNLIIRAHGEPREVYDYCEKNKINIIDCTCPFVKRAQMLASQLNNSGYKVVLIGDKDHPEVRGIAAHADNPIIIPNEADYQKEEIKKHNKIGILSQTTQKRTNFQNIVAKIISDSKETKVFNTICHATLNRQTAALKLCDEVDLMLVIGGRNSANTKRLYEICKEKITTHWITEKSEIQKEWFEKIGTVGITAGASTPKEQIESVVSALEKALPKSS